MVCLYSHVTIVINCGRDYGFIFDFQKETQTVGRNTDTQKGPRKTREQTGKTCGSCCCGSPQW